MLFGGPIFSGARQNVRVFKKEDFKYTMRQSGDGIVGVAWYDFH